MDTFSQVASTFLDLGDDSESEFMNPIKENFSLSGDLEGDKKAVLESKTLMDFTKKRCRAKREDSKQLDVVYKAMKKETMTRKDNELLKLELLSDDLKRRGKRQCQSCVYTSMNTRKVKKKRNKWQSDESTTSKASSITTSEDYDEEELEEVNSLYGCGKCGYRWDGCGECRKEEPLVRRPKIRWNLNNPHYQRVPSAPTYYPTEEEFQDPVVYISKIRPEAEKYGICLIIPPNKWTSKFDPEIDCDDEECQFFPKRQLISSLCVRQSENRSSIKNGKTTNGRYAHSKETCTSSDDEEFGFNTSDMAFNVRSFKAFADWSHRLYFQSPDLNIEDLSVEQTEGEFWRLVEGGGAENEFETFYGSDLDSRGFRKFLETQTGDHINWEVSRWPRSQLSVLKQVPVEDLITGVMVPWVYFGSSLSAFCWHVEDHALYSVNYHHKGATKLWYGVPSFAAHDFEAAMKDALPHLFESDPQLLHRLVTHLSPRELQQRGIPVYRIEHNPGSFVVTFPNGYHGGLNCGWNCAEAVNFAPADWLPHGTDILKKYRQQRRPTTFSYDSLLIHLVSSLLPNKSHENRIQCIDPQIIRYAVGELSLRIREEERRRKIAFEAGISQERRVETCQAAISERQEIVNSEDMDCEVCRCDLYLSGVTSSSSSPNSIVCPEHSSHLPSPRTLIYRYSINELQGMVGEALKLYPECEEFVIQAFRRVNSQRSSSFIQKGPVYGC